MEELSVGDRNEVNYKIRRGGQTKITVNLRKRVESLGKKLGKWKANLSQLFKLRVHPRVDFYINEVTRKIAVTLTKDETMHDMMEETLLKRMFVPFSLADHEVIAPMESCVSITMECEAPEESRISERVFPSSSIAIDGNFLKKGRHAIYFCLDPEPTDKWKRIEILYSCQVDGELDHRLPLSIEWPPTEIRRKVAFLVQLGSEGDQLRIGAVGINILQGSDSILISQQLPEKSAMVKQVRAVHMKMSQSVETRPDM